MKILLLAPHPFYQARGTPIAEKALVETLVAVGHEVDVLTYHEGEDLHLPGCTIHRIPRVPGLDGIRPGFSVKKLLANALLLPMFLRLLRRSRYDVVHAVEESAFMALLARRVMGVPYIYDMDSSLAQQMEDRFPALGVARGWLDRMERAAVRGSTAVLAVCRALEETAQAHDPDKLIARVEDASLLTNDGAHTRERLLEGEETGPTVLYVGNLEAYQGIDLLLEAFAYALAEVPAARLAVVGGDARSIDRYRQRVHALGVERSVRFLGPRPVAQLEGLLAQAHVVASPRTRGHNTPMKVYSYLDSGRALIATRLPTHTQVLDDDIALLADPSPAAFGAGLVRLLTDARLRARLGNAARARVREQYSREAQKRKISAFYATVQQTLAAPASTRFPPRRVQARRVG